jgi:hypothetical protein
VRILPPRRRVLGPFRTHGLRFIPGAWVTLLVRGASPHKMQRCESCRLSQPVRVQRVTYEGRSKTARCREVLKIGAGLPNGSDRRANGKDRSEEEAQQSYLLSVPFSPPVEKTATVASPKLYDALDPAARQCQPGCRSASISLATPRKSSCVPAAIIRCAHLQPSPFCQGRGVRYRPGVRSGNCAAGFRDTSWHAATLTRKLI